MQRILRIIPTTQRKMRISRHAASLLLHEATGFYEWLAYWFSQNNFVSAFALAPCPVALNNLPCTHLFGHPGVDSAPINLTMAWLPLQKLFSLKINISTMPLLYAYPQVWVNLNMEGQIPYHHVEKAHLTAGSMSIPGHYLWPTLLSILTYSLFMKHSYYGPAKVITK